MSGAGATTARRSLRVTEKALPQHNRQNNRAFLLQTLYRSGAMSRADLARHSGLTRPTVSALVASLAADGVIAEIGPQAAGRAGKPGTLIDVASDGFHTVALDLSSADVFTGAVIDLRGRVVVRQQREIDGARGEAAVELVEALLETLLQSTARPVLGIGVGTPGVVRLGVVQEAVNLGWTELPLRDRLQTRFGVPVHVGNDAQAAVRGIHSFGEVTGASVMVVTLEHGVGAGLILDGAIVEGEHHAAGEIGHVTVDPEGAMCACGRRGCLELALAAPELRRRLAGRPDSEADEVLAEAGRALGVVLAPIVGALDLTDVVLSGPTDLVDGPLLHTATDTVRQRTLPSTGDGVRMRAVDGAGDLVLLGGASLVLSRELGVS